MVWTIRGPVLWLILFINSAARSWKEYSERIFSGCPYRTTTRAISGPRLVAGIEWSARCSGDALIAPTAACVSDLVLFRLYGFTALELDYHLYMRGAVCLSPLSAQVLLLVDSNV